MEDNNLTAVGLLDAFECGVPMEIKYPDRDWEKLTWPRDNHGLEKLALTLSQDGHVKFRIKSNK